MSISIDEVEQTPCPACGQQALRIEWRLTARPVGDYSLAGAQMKFSAREVPWVVCDGCGVAAQGKRS